MVIGRGLTTGKQWTFHPDETVIPNSQLHGGASVPTAARTAPGGLVQNIQYTFELHGTEDSLLARIGRLLEEKNAELARAYELALS